MPDSPTGRASIEPVNYPDMALPVNLAFGFEDHFPDDLQKRTNLRHPPDYVFLYLDISRLKEAVNASGYLHKTSPTKYL
jgi:hypothetical protein